MFSAPNAYAPPLQIVQHLRSGLNECGEATELTAAMREDSLKLWRHRSVRLKYTLAAVAAGLKVPNLTLLNLS